VAIKYLETIYIHPAIRDKMISYAESKGYKNIGSITIIAKSDNNNIILMVEGGGLDLRPLFQFPLSEVLPEGWYKDVKFNNIEPKNIFKLFLKKYLTK
jgi:hypothetical protein